MFLILKKTNNLLKKIHQEEIKLEIFSKGPDDKFTTADFIIQKIFENYLGKFYPQIKIIGEEDTSTNVIKESEFFQLDENAEEKANEIKRKFFFEGNEGKINQVPWEEVVFYIDPIDSTNNYMKKSYAPVTVMLGMSWKGEPFFGILHYFAFDGNLENSKTVFNIPGEGVYECNLNLEGDEGIKKMDFLKRKGEINILTSKSRTEEKTSKCKNYI